MLHNVHARASEVPITRDELAAAALVLNSRHACVSTVQRKLRIGWNRAADVVVALKGVDALPPVARKLFP